MTAAAIAHWRLVRGRCGCSTCERIAKALAADRAARTSASKAPEIPR